MSDLELILNNVASSMAMEDMPLSAHDIERIRDCLNGKCTFDNAVSKVILQYKGKK